MALTNLIPIPAGINPGVRSAKQATMLQVLGSPRHTYDRECQPVTNPTLKSPSKSLRIDSPRRKEPAR